MTGSRPRDNDRAASQDEPIVRMATDLRSAFERFAAVA